MSLPSTVCLWITEYPHGGGSRYTMVFYGILWYSMVYHGIEQYNQED